MQCPGLNALLEHPETTPEQNDVIWHVLTLSDEWTQYDEIRDSEYRDVSLGLLCRAGVVRVKARLIGHKCKHSWSCIALYSGMATATEVCDAASAAFDIHPEQWKKTSESGSINWEVHIEAIRLTNVGDEFQLKLMSANDVMAAAELVLWLEYGPNWPEPEISFKPLRPSASDATWLRITDVSRLIDENKGTVSRLITKGELKDNGLAGSDRRVDAGSVLRYAESKGIAINEN